MHSVLKGDINSKSLIHHGTEWNYRINACSAMVLDVDPRYSTLDLHCTCTVAQLAQDYELMSSHHPPTPSLVHCAIQGNMKSSCFQSAGLFFYLMLAMIYGRIRYGMDQI